MHWSSLLPEVEPGPLSWMPAITGKWQSRCEIEMEGKDLVPEI